MIFKQRDSTSAYLQQLEMAVRFPKSPREQKRWEKELACRRAGLEGEKEATYHIDFHLTAQPNWAVLHDLRIVCNDRVAQIDHLLISRLFEIYVVESKSFRTKIRYANGGWERINFNHWEGIPCPVQQNERHIAVLKDLITESNLVPTRLGLTMTPDFHNVVVVMPSCSIPENHPEDAKIYRMDKLVAKVRAEDPSPLDMFRIISQDTLYQFATKLAAHHCPAPTTQITLRETINATQPIQSSARPVVQCQGCGGPLQVREADFCGQHNHRFGGQLLCRKCQGFAPSQLPNARRTNSARQPESCNESTDSICSRCGNAVDRKVTFYCRAILKLPAGRILCRNCQPSVHGKPKALA
jgi:hypothetical protein